jgi:hypothetical protein
LKKHFDVLLEHLKSLFVRNGDSERLKIQIKMWQENAQPKQVNGKYISGSGRDTKEKNKQVTLPKNKENMRKWLYL